MTSVLPCICVFARITLPPKAAPIAWWPRHTPRIGSLPVKASMAPTQMPASAGEHGPGDSTSWSGFKAWMPSSVISSLRKTRTSSPSSAKYCTRLNVKES